MKGQRVLFSKASDEYGTPRDLYERLDAEFHFTLDPCATAENHKCEKYYTAEDDGLTKSWAGERVFCNPPYSQIKAWARKARAEADRGTLVVMLVFARTDTAWFHDYVYGAAELRFIRGRLHFETEGGCSPGPAPAPSMLVIFNGEGE